jgi:superfamily I DNA/RNA helicase
MSSVGEEGLKMILASNERLVVICPDEKVDEINGIINKAVDTAGNAIGQGVTSSVLGIRQAKGLEFTDVVIVDFFSSIASIDQKAWKRLLSGHSLADQIRDSNPQVETQLKMLYTAITRSCNRLIFAETRSSLAGDVFFHWLQSQLLAEELATIDASDEGRQGGVETRLMTGDEWRVRGMELALGALAAE